MLKNNQQKEEKQLGLGIENPPHNFKYSILRWAHTIEQKYMLIPFWTNGLIWSALASMYGISFIILILILKYYPVLPPSIPLIYNDITGLWNIHQKSYLYAIPAVLCAFAFITTVALPRVYYMNKRLIQMICLLIICAFCISFIGVIEIIRMGIF